MMRKLAVAGGLGLAVVGVAWLRRSWAVITVVGSSMEPTFHNGDRLAVRRTPRLGTHRTSGLSVRRTSPDVVSTGEVVVVRRPGGEPGWSDQPVEAGGAAADGRRMIKRVAAVPGEPVPAGVPMDDAVVPDGKLVLLGDNPEASFDSRMVGYFPATFVYGRVVRRMG
jgi:signal peptidase I